MLYLLCWILFVVCVGWWLLFVVVCFVARHVLLVVGCAVVDVRCLFLFIVYSVLLFVCSRCCSLSFVVVRCCCLLCVAVDYCWLIVACCGVLEFAQCLPIVVVCCSLCVVCCLLSCVVCCAFGCRCSSCVVVCCPWFVFVVWY